MKFALDGILALVDRSSEFGRNVSSFDSLDIQDYMFFLSDDAFDPFISKKFDINRISRDCDITFENLPLVDRK
jgi:hypothetical protein